LEFNKEFYNDRNLEQPILHETIDKLSKDFTIDFSRSDSLFLINNVENNLTADFRIYNGQSGNLMYQTTLNLVSGVKYFIWSEFFKFLDVQSFKKFRIEVIVDNNIIQNEFIHI
jgi:hypothetical protein